LNLSSENQHVSSIINSKLYDIFDRACRGKSNRLFYKSTKLNHLESGRFASAS